MKSVLNSVDNGAAFMEHIAGEVTTIATCWRIEQQPAKGVVLQAGTAQAGTARTLTLNASAVTLNDNYAGYTATLNSGSGASQSRNVVTSRKNLLSYSKVLSNAAYSVVNGATKVSFNSQLASDGTMTADVLEFAAQTNSSTLRIVTSSEDGITSYTYSVEVKVATGTYSFTLDSYNVTGGHMESPALVATTVWQTFTWSWTRPASATGTDIRIRNGITGAAQQLIIGEQQLEIGLVPTALIHTEATPAVGIAVDTPWSSNLALNSNDFTIGSGWAKNNCIIDNTSVIAPDGSATASHIKSYVFTGRIAVSRDVAVVANTKNTASIYLKAAEWDKAVLFIDQTTVAEGAYYGNVALNLATGVSSNPAVVTLESAGDGWYRAALAATPTVATYRMEVVPIDPAAGGVNAVVGDGVSGIYIWHAQLNIGAVAAPYIATGATPALLPDATSSYAITPTTKTVCFTNASQDITYQGLVYESSLGADPSSINSTAQLNVDNLNITGSLVAPAITHVDLDNGLWDYARVLVFAVNYADLTMGHMVLRSGYLGQTTTGRTIYDAEIRGLTQALQQDQGRLCEERCDAAFGDSRCGVTKASYTFAGTVTSVADGRTFGISLMQANTYFTGGELIFVSGLNRGAVFDIRTSTVGNVVLYEAANHQIAVGDNILVVAGCDKLRTTCFTKYNNVINHRGFPDIPGVDKMISGT